MKKFIGKPKVQKPEVKPEAKKAEAKVTRVEVTDIEKAAELTNLGYKLIEVQSAMLGVRPKTWVFEKC
jgi:hypothetical protein